MSPGFQELEAIRYLEFCIGSLASRDPPIHNYLISLYVRHQNQKLLPYLLARGKEADELPYDIQVITGLDLVYVFELLPSPLRI